MIEKRFTENHLNFKNEKDIFFRVIKNGSQTNSHGWLDIESGEIFQWG